MNFKKIKKATGFILMGVCIFFSGFDPVWAEPGKPAVKLISVYDNYQANPEFKTAWGFGCVVETPLERILFDTGGAPEILLFNMRKMGIDPGSIRKVVISHIHGDHLNGLTGFLEKNNNMIAAEGAGFVAVSGPEKISDYIYTTGELCGPPVEQSLVIDSPKGLIVITGCAHPGIVNIIKKAKEVTGKENVHLVMGGFHHPSIEVVKAFRKMGVEKVAPSHCTGDPARKAFAKEYKDDFIANGTGNVIEIY